MLQVLNINGALGQYVMVLDGLAYQNGNKSTMNPSHLDNTNGKENYALKITILQKIRVNKPPSPNTNRKRKPNSSQYCR